MKIIKIGIKWVYVSCVLWILEVSIVCFERMELIMKIFYILFSWWVLVCNLCKLKIGVCIQCFIKSCIIVFYVICVFEYGLEMKIILDEGDEVKFKLYCFKYS